MATSTVSRHRYDVLPLEELAAALRHLPQWRYEHRRLVRTVPTTDPWPLLEAVCSVECALDHHTVATLDAGVVVLEVWTHVRDAVTAADLELARRVEELLR